MLNTSTESEADQQCADVSRLRPEMQQQWYHEFNTSFAGEIVKPHSNKEATWSCDKCPDGHPHVWQSQVRKRTRGANCPYCTSRLLCSHNSLVAQAPEVAASWDYERNEGSIPEHYHQFSRRNVHWKCGVCGHEWQARIKDRTLRNSGCNACYQRRKGNTKLPTLAESKPHFMSQWHHVRNQAENLHPEHLTLGSKRPVWWLCNECKLGRPHEWQQAPQARKHSGCPYCAHRKVCVCNSLATKFPKLAAEMDNAENYLTSAEVMPGSNLVVQWKSAERGLWTQEVKRRTEGAAYGYVLYEQRSN